MRWSVGQRLWLLGRQLQTPTDGPCGGEVSDEGNNSHVGTTEGTQQGVGLIYPSDQLRPTEPGLAGELSALLSRVLGLAPFRLAAQLRGLPVTSKRSDEVGPREPVSYSHVCMMMRNEKSLMDEDTFTKESPVAFFVLTFLLALPFYVLNALAYSNVLFEPEIGALYVSLFTLTPIASASILTFRSGGWKGVKRLLGRIFDFKRIAKKKWYAAILLLMPLIFMLSVGVTVMSDVPIPAALTPAVALPAVLLFFFILAAGEEVGWMGYAFEPMQARGGALEAALVLGVIWAVWHVPFFVFMMPDRVILLAQLLTLVGTRVLLAWIFNNTGKSVFAAILFHAADNAALVTMPEIQAISPWGAVVHSGFVLIAAGVVTLLWGPRTLARFRFGN